MKKFTKFCMVVALLAGSYVYASSETYPSASFRYKVTVEVETPEGIKTGSAVRQIDLKTEKNLIRTSGKGVNARVKGEAVAVDLGERGILFSILNNDGFDNLRMVKEAFPMPEDSEVNYFEYYSNLFE